MLQSSPSSLVSMSNESSTVSTEDQTALLVGRRGRSNSSASKRSVSRRPKRPNHIFNLENVGNDHFRDKNRKYCRSYSKNLIRVISQWTCAKCGNNDAKFHSANPPMIAQCGHYFHKDCCYTGNRVECYICLKMADLHGVNKPLPDKIHLDFFKAIEEEPFVCSNTKCERIHDLSNMVYFPSVSGTETWCVWCAADKNELKGEKASLASLQNATRANTVNEDDQKLTSLNRITHDSGWALDTCCLCRKQLRNNEDVDIVWLPCEHIGHNKCDPKKEPVRGKPVKCLLCKKDSVYLRDLLPVRKWRGSYYLQGYIEETYRKCKSCNQKHPEDNYIQKNGTCKWCAVEELEMAKKS